MGNGVFTPNDKHHHFIVDYNSKFLVIKKIAGLNSDALIQACKITFTEFQFPSKLISDAGTNFVSEQFHEICRCLYKYNAVSSLYTYQSNGQAEACMKFVKCTTKCYETNTEINLALSTDVLDKNWSSSIIIQHTCKNYIT